MSAVKVSPKYQVVIPSDIRRRMGLKSGTRVKVLQIGARIELVRLRPLREYRGFLPGIDTDVPRDEDRV